MTDSLDKVTLEVLRNSFASLVDEMGITLSRSALSLVITFGRDFSGAVLTKEGDLVKQGVDDGLPAHVGTIPFTAKYALECFREDVASGDILLTNDPYVGTHLPDIRMIRPIFWEGELVANLCLCCHWTDVGGSVPGSFVCDARDSMTEGVTFTPVKIVERGHIREDIQRLILRNVRLPSVTRGDIRATITALETGDQRFQSIARRHGIRRVLDMFAVHIRETEQNFRRLISEFPPGEYHALDYVDRDPADRQRSAPIKIALTLRLRDGTATYDYTHSDEQGHGAINAGLAATWSGVLVATKSLFPEVDLCQGLNNAIEVITRPGSVVHAEWPAAVCGVGSCAFQKVYDTVLATYAQVAPDRVIACGANETNFILAGDDERRGGPPYIMYCWTEGGYGATRESDNHSFISMYASGSKNQCVEAFEQEYPILWELFELIPDSGGAGRTRGGLGTVRRIRLAHGREALLSAIGDRERFPSWGLFGGMRALNQGLALNPGTLAQKDLGVYLAGEIVRKDDFWDFWSGGGGGYGDPLEREAQAVLEDVLDGYVSLAGARQDYGVVIHVVDAERLAYEIDIAETQRLRASLRNTLQQQPSPMKTYDAAESKVRWVPAWL
jgi:N-methylhydantoinase B